MTTLSIAGTRIHRDLADYASFGCTKQLDIISPIPLNANCTRCRSLNGLDNSERSGRIEWRANRVPNTLSDMEVAINGTSDQDKTPQTIQNGSHVAFIEGQLCEKPGRQSSLGESVENDVECQAQVSS